MQFSQSFLDEIIKFLCSLESHFQVDLKNIPTFYDRTHMTKVMADKSLSTIFFETPCMHNADFQDLWDLLFRAWQELPSPADNGCDKQLWT